MSFSFTRSRRIRSAGPCTRRAKTHVLDGGRWEHGSQAFKPPSLFPNKPLAPTRKATRFCSRLTHGASDRRRFVCGMLKIVAAVLAVVPVESFAVEIYDDFPSEVRPSERYVIYSHGLIVEGDNPRPVHPTRGVYDFPAIKQALFSGGNFNLIAHQRPKNTEIQAYVSTLESWVQHLLAVGVKPSRITLVGFSRGGHLTAYASGRLAVHGLNTAIMGACTDGDIVHDPPLMLGGNLLSIYETTDSVLSCAKIAQRSRLTSFEEIAISTGKEHGAFFQPLPEWVEPLKKWIQKTNR